MSALLSINIMLYIATAILAVLMVYLGFNMNSKIHFVYMLVMFFVGLDMLANIFEYNAGNLGGALVARKILYFGNSYAEWCLFVFCILFLGYKNPRWLTGSLFALHSIIFIAALNLDNNALVYKSYKLEFVGNISHIVSTPGPLNIVHRVLMLFYMIAIPVICFRYWYTNRGTNMARHSFVLGLCAVFPGLGYVPVLIGFNPKIDISCLFFIVSTVLSFILIVKKNMFNIVDVARDDIIDNLDDGIIILDKDMSILYLNQRAKDIFPHITNETDRSDVIVELCEGVNKQFKCDGKTYNLAVNTTMHKDKHTGYTLVFNDITHLADYASKLEDEVKAKVSKITAIQKQVLISLANMIEMRDDTTGEHVKRTTEYVNILANGLRDAGKFTDELTDQKVEHITEAAALHDIGKIAVSDSILCKPGKLEPEEFEKIKEHTTAGGDILTEILKDVGDVPYLEEAKEMALYHHEKFDGNGYPEGRSGEDIPLSARIMAVADVFDALISKRQYKDAFSFDKAFGIIEESSGSHFDPEIVDVFMKLRPEIEGVVSHNK